MSYLFSRARTQVCAAVVLIGVAPALSACNGPSSAFAPSASAIQLTRSGFSRPNQATFQFSTLNNGSATANYLTGINNQAKITGYDTSGPSGDARGFVIYKPYQQGNFRNENYPQAVSTYVTSDNNVKTIAGYYTNTNGAIFGFIQSHGVWTSYKDPELRKGTSNITELLGISDADLAVGFYQDQNQVNHAFELDAGTGKFHNLLPPGLNGSAEATGINGKGDIVGYFTNASGNQVGFLLKGSNYTIFSVPGAKATQALSVQWQDQISGSYQDTSGNTHGFVLTNPLTSQQWTTVDEPDATGPTVVTGINNHHYIVGWYVDAYGTDGFLATPSGSK